MLDLIIFCFEHQWIFCENMVCYLLNKLNYEILCNLHYKNAYTAIIGFVKLF